MIGIAVACALMGGAVGWLIARDDDGGAVLPPKTVVSTVTAAGAAPDADEGEPPRRSKRSPEAAPRTRAIDALAGPGHPVIWVRDGEQVPIHSAPGGDVIKTVGRRTEFGSIQSFSVVKREGRWAGVPTPFRDNGELGWVKLDPHRLQFGSTPYEIVADLSEYRLSLLRGDRVVGSFKITIGAAGSPTPTGRFAITDTFRGDLGPAYGCCAVATTARQPNLPSGWLGGDRIAIHGTSSTLGIQASLGCLRARDDDVSMLVDRVGVGTPVIIHQ
jgi:hypothetical protein